MIRTFIALDLPSEVKDYLFELHSKLNDVKLAKVKWVYKKNYHITLKFLGELNEDQVKKLKVLLKEVKFKKFKLELNKLGYFPGGLKINAIWVGLKDEKPIIELQKVVDECTINFGDLKLGGHITLGRIKSIKDKKKFVKKIDEKEIENIKFEVSSFSLCKSELSKDGPTYSVLDSYSLR